MKNKGFTLIELSIVVVIIGLIVAGVIGGQSLLRQAKLLQLGKELGVLESSVTTFKLAYDQYPGDMTNAYSYWGSACASSAEYCNGNGNNQIEYTGSPAGDYNRETHRFWQHLSLAGILKRTFTGEGIYKATSDEIYFSTTNIVRYHTETDSDMYSFPADKMAGKYISLKGSAAIEGEGWWGTPALTVMDAHSVDKKIDDGVANTGKFNATGAQCSASRATAGGANYQSSYFSDDTRRCFLQYHLF